MSRTCKNVSAFAITLFGVVFAALGIASATSGEKNEWQAAVRDEIWLEHFCRVTFFSHIVERATKDGKIVMVKVHCEDKRSFDAIRQNNYSPFTFSECTPREKTSC